MPYKIHSNRRYLQPLTPRVQSTTLDTQDPRTTGQATQPARDPDEISRLLRLEQAGAQLTDEARARLREYRRHHLGKYQIVGVQDIYGEAAMYAPGQSVYGVAAAYSLDFEPASNDPEDPAIDAADPTTTGKATQPAQDLPNIEYLLELEARGTQLTTTARQLLREYRSRR